MTATSRRCWILTALMLFSFVSVSTRAFTVVSSKFRTKSHSNRQGASVVSLLATRSTSTFQSLASNSTASSIDNQLKPSQQPAAVVFKQRGHKKTLKSRLREDLREYRTQQSAPLNKRAYTIFTNAVLEDICAALPSTLQELSAVKGIGPQKLKHYGHDILGIVAQYIDANGNLRQAADSPPTQQQPQTSQPSLPPKPERIDPQTLNPEQRQAADLLLSDTRPNGFVTGSAGTGKSYVLKYVVQQLQHRPQQQQQQQPSRCVVAVCAPTGVAAVHVGGNTLHSFFGIGLGTGSVTSLVKKVTKKTEVQKRINDTQVLIIDECSMLSSDLLETLDSVVRQVRHEGVHFDKPFGGMQVICFGDFFQLPPVSSGFDYKPFCFESQVWAELGLTENMIELEQVQRQDNIEFVNLLNKVRIGEVTQQDIQQLNEQCVISPQHPLPTDGIVPTRLYSRNKNVDEENESRLMALEGTEVVCRARDIWREDMPKGTLVSVKKQMTESLSKELPDEVRLKVGAQVMLTRNKDLDQNLVNGSRGVIVRFNQASDGEPVPVVRFDSGLITPVHRVEAARYNPDGEAGCVVRLQVPLKLAWALTIHKCQGSTLSRAILDISSTFEFGQCYVALSRVQSLKGLWLIKPAQIHNIKVSPQVLNFYRRRGLER